MQMNVQTSAARPGPPLYRARQKTVRVREQLEVASAELGLTNTVLGQSLPESVKQSKDVKHVLTQNEAIEGKVQQAADELQVVSDLLEEEVAERSPQIQAVVLDLLSTVGDFQLVKAVANEAEANLWLDENAGNWDLAVIDLILAEGTGLGVVARARDRPAGSKVVVFSDYATEGIRKHCIKLGADAAFQKGEGMRDFLDFCAAVAHPPSSCS